MKDLSSDPHKINLQVGGTHQLRLQGPGGTGYTWEYSIEGSAGIVSVLMEQIGEPPHNLSGGPIPDTYSLDGLFVITALKPGMAKVKLVLRRPWEHDNPPLKELCFDVFVSE